MRTDEDGGTAGRHLLVGVDGSPGARAALAWALQEAAARHCGLRVVSVHGVPADGEDAELRRRARELVDDVRRMPGLAATVEVPVEVDAVTGAAAERLARASGDAELLVVGGRERSAPVRTLLDSVALRCIATAHCPVVVVPGTLATVARDRVVVGFDGSAEADGALEAGIRAAVLRGWTEVVVVSTVWLGGRWADIRATEEHLREDVAGAVCDQVAAAVERAAGRVGARGRDLPEVRIMVLAGQPDEGLLGLSQDAHLLVLGNHDRGALSGMLLGSVATGCTLRAHRPTMVVPPGVTVRRREARDREVLGSV